jgi:hypothetical protein
MKSLSYSRIISSKESGLYDFWLNCNAMRAKLEVARTFNFSQIDSNSDEANLHYEDLFEVTYKLFSVGIFFSLVILIFENLVHHRNNFKNIINKLIRLGKNFILFLRRTCSELIFYMSNNFSSHINEMY